MEYLGKILAISHTELTAVMTEQNIKNLRHRGQLQQLRRACPGQEAVFAVDSLPEKYRQKALAMHPIPERDIITGSLVLEPDGAAFVYYHDYLLPDGRHLPEKSIEELLRNASILNALDKKLMHSDQINAAAGRKAISKSEFWQRAAAYLADNLADSTLPKNARMLQAKYNAYKKEGYSALVSSRWCNSNAAKVNDGAKQGALVTWLAQFNNFDNQQVADKYNAAAEQNGWRPITATTVGNWRRKTDLITTAARLGTKKFYDRKAMQVKRSRPSAPFLMWSLDGWVCELRYQRTKTDKNGRNTTTYYDRLVVEVVLDPCCDYIIGYAIGAAEDANLITSAIRNALQHSKELFGVMHRTNQLQSDNFARSAMQKVYAAVADKVTPARVGNAKSKPIERFFGYLNTTYCQQCYNWSGFGVTTDPDKQPNSEAANFYKKEIPDLDGVLRQIEAMIEADRRKKVGEFKAMYANLQDDRKLTFSEEQWLYYFGSEAARTSRLTGGGLCPTILGEKRAYDCFDITFREHAFEDWTIKYDPQDLGKILAVNQDGTLRYMLEEKYVQPMALADRKEGDSEQLQRIRAYNENLKEHIIARLADAQEQASNVIKFPQVSQVLGRTLITDSRGQHKTPKRQAQMTDSEQSAIGTGELKPTGTEAPAAAPPQDIGYDMF